MRTDELDYPFDASLIATTPAHPRDDARLMVLHRGSGAIEHRCVRDLPQFLGANDHLVLNRTSVLRARVLVREPMSGRASEGLLLEPIMHDRIAHGLSTASTSGTHWRMLLRQSKRFAPQQRLSLINAHGAMSDDSIMLLARDDDAWIVRLDAGARGGDGATVLERSGCTPLPPYILKARRDSALSVSDDDDRAEYETVYADPTARGSVAAPTAGLHFTDALLTQLASQGVAREEVILHVGAGTFKPIEVDDLAQHAMHSEHFRVPALTLSMLARIAADRARGTARVVAVGTTSVRALESIPAPLPSADMPFEADTRILIAPGHTFRFVDALLTNFHLPRSTLLALVGAFTGMELMREAYACAVRERYRFYSYGDAMLIV